MSGLLTYFSNQGLAAKIKLVIVGSTASKIENVMLQLSSLNQEHVSPTGLIRQEISRHTPLGQKAEAAARRGQSPPGETVTAIMRRWFWARKPDAGFALTGFPATLLQAKVFDEWLDARGESLDGVIDAADANDTASLHIVNHYRAHGLLLDDEALAPVLAK
ncbi:adenylate kinase [Ereboglobus sp. PH5-10]|uniref:nucleoside monophosphate kinase n=1 Tax=Ereboglobus sp. PH5-10 TaxID=2940629 RepID=UPI0024075AC0|nr:nucleoside monophosphate kinase [Ereboglobus sp. PH5-10]MDF9826299.1 adenylate kinase [Ereboglobus sp. PH5-10]